MNSRNAKERRRIFGETKIILRDFLGQLLFKNYVGQYSLQIIDIKKIKRSTIFFPTAKIPFTVVNFERSRFEMINAIGRFHVSLVNITKNSTEIDNVINYSRACYTFRHGIPPELTGEAFWYLKNAEVGYYFDNISDYKKFTNRYVALNRLNQQVALERKLLSRKELNKRNFREKGGINVIQLSSGEYIWCGGGLHRLAIANANHLSHIPVCVVFRDEELIQKRYFTKIFSKKLPQIYKKIYKYF